MRKQMQVETYRKRLEEENKKAEETEKRRQERAEERKRALDEWLKIKSKRSTSREGKSKRKGNRLTKLDASDFKSNFILAITDMKTKGGIEYQYNTLEQGTEISVD